MEAHPSVVAEEVAAEAVEHFQLAVLAERCFAEPFLVAGHAVEVLAEPMKEEKQLL